MRVDLLWLDCEAYRLTINNLGEILHVQISL